MRTDFFRSPLPTTRTAKHPQPRHDRVNKKQTSTLGCLLLAIATLFVAATPVAAHEQESNRFELVSKTPMLTAFNARRAKIAETRDALLKSPDNLGLHLALIELYLAERNGEAAKTEIASVRDLGAAPNVYVLPLARALYLTGETDAILNHLPTDKLSPENHARLLTIQAKVQISEQNFQAARALLTQAKSATAKIPDPWIIEGALYHLEQQFAKSESALDRALALDVHNAKIFYWKAENARALGQPSKALELASRSLAEDPEDTHSLLSRALAYLSLGRMGDAQDDLFTLLTIEPDNIMGHYLKAHLLAGQGQTFQALEALNNTPGIETFSPALYLMATLNMSLDRLDDARENLEKYISLSNNIGKAYLLLSIIHLRQDHPSEALPLLQELAASNGTSPQITKLLGLAHSALGNYVEAAFYLSEAARTEPQDSELTLQLAQTYLASGEVKAAISALEATIDHAPASRTANSLLILTRLAAGDYRSARKTANRIKEEIPDSPFPYTLLANIDMAEQNTKAARRNLATALKKEPNFYPAHFTAARVAANEGDFETAKSHYISVLNVFPDLMPALLRLASTEQSLGKVKVADQILRHAQDIYPDSPEPLLATAQLYLHQKNEHAGLIAAEKLCHRFPGHIEGLETLALAQRENGLLEQSLNSYGRLVAAMPDNPAALARFGYAQSLAGHWKKAAGIYDRVIVLAPEESLARSERIRIEIRLSGAEKAEQFAVAQAAQLPDPYKGELVLAGFYRMTGQTAAAVTHYRAALTGLAEDQIAIEVAKGLAELGHPDDATGQLETWLSAHPDADDVRFSLANLYTETGNHKKATEEFRRLLRNRPDHPALLNNLAWAYLRAGNGQRGVKTAARAHRLAPGSTDIQDTYGWLLVQTGDTAKGLDFLQQAATARPGDGQIGYHYAAALSLNGQPRRAQTLLGNLLSAKSKFSERAEAEDLYRKLSSSLNGN